MELFVEISRKFEQLRANHALFFALVLMLVSAAFYIADKHFFDYADKKSENKFVIYSYQLEQSKEAVNSQLEFILRNKLREKVDLDGDTSRKIDNDFDMDVKILFDNYQTLIRKLRILERHSANVLSETQSLLPGAVSRINDETYDNLNKSLEVVSKSFDWLDKLEDKMTEQILLRNKSGELAKQEQTDEVQIALVINNIKLINSLFSDDYSLLKRNYDPEPDIASFKAASVMLVSTYDFIVKKHNERVEADKRKKSILMLVLFFILLWLNFRKELQSPTK